MSPTGMRSVKWATVLRFKNSSPTLNRLFFPRASVAKLVDAQDLKSWASVKRACRFKSGPGHQLSQFEIFVKSIKFKYLGNDSLAIIADLVFPSFFVDNKAMEKQSTLSTSIDSDLKKALAAFCKKRGLKIQSVVENAIREQLEDEIDLASYDERKNEEEISLAAVLKKIEK